MFVLSSRAIATGPERFYVILLETLAANPSLQPVLTAVERILGRLGTGRRVPPILLQGETGTGKGVLALAIHHASPRAAGRFVTVNCSAIPESLLEAELFGFERGAFTDARQSKPGLMQTANEGTLFLDEVGLLPTGLQAKLLTAIDERRVRRLGSVRDEVVDVLIVAATNADLASAVRAGRFREDLYHRLAVLTFTLPPLRARGAEIVLLAQSLLDQACRDLGMAPKILQDDARAALLAYAWPGNVRELVNTVERMALLKDGVTITAHDLALPHQPPAAEPGASAVVPSDSLRNSLDSFERTRVQEALRAAGGRVSVAAQTLGIPRSTLRYHLKRLNVDDVDRSRALPGRGAQVTEPLVESPAGPVRWEQRQIAFLRVVAEGSPASPLVSGRDIATLAEKVTGLGGRVEEVETKGITAVFGVTPLDDALDRAAHAARAMFRATGSGSELSSIGLRVALHLQPALVAHIAGATHIEQHVRGAVVTTLEELVQRAAPATIVASEATAHMLGRRYRLERLDSPGPGVVYRLLGPDVMSAEALTPFVGRDRELTLLEDLRTRVMIDGARFITVTGDAGIGKSRLLREFRESLRSADVTWIEAGCTSPSAVVPYFLVGGLLRAALDMTDDERGQDRRALLEQRLAEHGLDVPDHDARVIAPVLGMADSVGAIATPAAITSRGRVSDVTRRVLLHSARRRPVVVLIEDVQWMDATSRACLQSVVKGLSAGAILFIATARSSAGGGVPWTRVPRATEFSLEPLGRRASRELIRAACGGDVVPEASVHMILAKAEGNPLFLEELARDALQRPVSSGAALPPSIRALVQRRVDDLPATPRELLETASVLGDEFSRALLQAVWDPAVPFPAAALEQLVNAGLLVERGGAEARSEAFHHVLVREAVYEALEQSRRERLHQRAGEVLEARHADPTVVLGPLAYHFARGTDRIKAIKYFVALAISAGQSHARDEALSALNEAMSQIERLPADTDQTELFAWLVSRQRDVLFNLTKINRGTLDFLLRQRDRVEDLPDRTLRALYFLWLSRVAGPLGEFTLSIEAGQRAIIEAERLGDGVLAAAARAIVAARYGWAGRLLEGLECAQQALGALEGTPNLYWLAHGYRSLAFNYLLMGQLADATSAAERLAAVGEELEDPFFEFSADWMQSMALIQGRDVERAVKRCHEMLERAPGPLEIAQASALLAAAHLESGRHDAAIDVLEPLITHADRLRQSHVQGAYAAVLAEALRRRGDVDRALSVATAGLAATREAGYRFGMGLALRALGQIADTSGDRDQAAAFLVDAIETFQSMPARLDLARTRLLLGELYLRHGDARGADLVDQATRELDALGLTA